MNEKLISEHRAAFGADPALTVFAPGRVNVIGEHTDYNGGLVMPMALEMGIYVAAARNSTGKLRIRSMDFDKNGEFDLSALVPEADTGWANCPKGIVKILQDHGLPVDGMDITMTGTLPIGAGLSSSAAAEVSVGFTARELFGFPLDKVDLARYSQAAEHEFTGTKCGIMDQLISAVGKKDTLLQVNCASLDTSYIPFETGSACLVITNTSVKHDLASSAYNTRREECNAGFEAAQQFAGAIETLSDVPLEALEDHQDLFGDTVFKRVHHVLSENRRVRDCSAALGRHDLVQAGKELTASHMSLKDNYEVTCAELDWLVDHALTIDGVYGSRMTGGGFGGCTVTLLEKEAVPAYRESLSAYAAAFGKQPDTYDGIAGDGVRTL